MFIIHVLPGAFRFEEIVNYNDALFNHLFRWATARRLADRQMKLAYTHWDNEQVKAEMEKLYYHHLAITSDTFKNYDIYNGFVMR